MYGEQEVFLIPVNVFRMINVEHDKIGMKTYVMFEDCELPSQRDPLAPIVRYDFAEFPRKRTTIAIAQVCEWICYKKEFFSMTEFFLVMSKTSQVGKSVS